MRSRSLDHHMFPKTYPGIETGPDLDHPAPVRSVGLVFPESRNDHVEEVKDDERRP
jgi:hypothetical protein